MGIGQSLSLSRGVVGPQAENRGLRELRGSGHPPPPAHGVGLTPREAKELPSRSCNRPSGRCGEHPDHPPCHLAQALRRRSRKQSQEAAQSPGEGRGGARDPPPGRCPRTVGAPMGPLDAQAPVPAPPPSRGGRWVYSQSLGRGRRPSCAQHPACVRGLGAPAAGRPPCLTDRGLTSHFLPAQPASRKPRPWHPRAPPPSASPDTAPRALRPGLGRAGGRRPGRPQGLRSMNNTAPCWPVSRARSRFRGHSSFLKPALFRSTGPRLGLWPLGADPLAGGQPGQAGQRRTTGGLEDSALLSLRAAPAHRGPGVGRSAGLLAVSSQSPTRRAPGHPRHCPAHPHSWVWPCPDPLLQEVVPRGAVCLPGAAPRSSLTALSSPSSPQRVPPPPLSRFLAAA